MLGACRREGERVRPLGIQLHGPDSVWSGRVVLYAAQDEDDFPPSPPEWISHDDDYVQSDLTLVKLTMCFLIYELLYFTTFRRI